MRERHNPSGPDIPKAISREQFANARVVFERLGPPIVLDIEKRTSLVADHGMALATLEGIEGATTRRRPPKKIKLEDLGDARSVLVKFQQEPVYDGKPSGEYLQGMAQRVQSEIDVRVDQIMRRADRYQNGGFTIVSGFGTSIYGLVEGDSAIMAAGGAAIMAGMGYLNARKRLLERGNRYGGTPES